MALPYPTKVVLPFDIATAQDMNERHANDVALANGTGLDDGSVTISKISPFVDRQANNTATSLTGAAIVAGWAQLPATSAKTQVMPITLSPVFLNTPIVTATIAGYKTGTATDVDATSPLNVNAIACYVDQITSAGFRLRATASEATLPNVPLMITWTAIGSR